MPKVQPAAEVCVAYSLFDLPTAQHKAGLAGLLLLIESMRQRGLGPLPMVNGLTATSVRVTFTQPSIQAVFDDLYDAEIRETESKTKWAGKAPKREEMRQLTDLKTGKVKKSKIFVYDTVVPKASFLEHYYPGEENGWLKLWRNMVWESLRTRDKNRQVYEQRATGKSSGEARKVWNDLAKLSSLSNGNTLLTAEISGSLCIGVQEANAEKVAFLGRVDHNLLLHFWPLVLQVFVPQAIKRDAQGEFTGSFEGYVITIPEISDLEEFCDVFPRSLAALDPQMRGYRPRASIIDLPAEGGLEFLRHLALLSQQKAGSGDLRYSVSAIELFHLEKRGNNVRMLAADRIAPRGGLLSQYEGLRAFCRNPLFKAQLLLNLLRGVDWYEGFARLFAIYPWEFFIYAESMPVTFPFFSSDVRKKFEILSDEFQRRLEAYAMADTTDPRPQSLEKRIYDMIGAYVRSKAEAKSGVQWAEFKDKKTADGKMAIPEAYLEARQKVCADLFLALRSRRDQDFVEYFTSTICSVPQFLPPDEYIFVSQALLESEGWERVKTLSMLALAAHS